MNNYQKNTNFFIIFGKENCIFLATRSFLWSKICRKCDSGRGFVPDPTGGAHDAPPDRLVGWGGDIPPHTPLHSAPRYSRLRRSARRLRRLDRPALPDIKSCHHHFLTESCAYALAWALSVTAVRQICTNCPSLSYWLCLSHVRKKLCRVLS